MPIVYRATRSMRHNPLCFTGHARSSTFTINCLASFLVLWRASSASPRSWRTKRFWVSITNVTARYARANLIEASSIFRFSAGAGLCRINPPRNSSSCCRPAISKHLRLLRSAGLVVTRQDGTARICSLNAKPLRGINDWLRDYETFWAEACRT